jgi:predicted O-methyltransferase YrrM
MSFHEYVDHPDRRVAFEAAVGAMIARAGARFLRRRIPPSYPELAALAPRGVHTDAVSLLTGAAPWASMLSSEQLEQFGDEHERLAVELDRRHRERALAFPERWAVESGTSFLLYTLTRVLRPRQVIELGVGNGASSYYLLRALEENGEGTLVSLDIASQAGGLLADRERAGWDFRVIDRKRSTHDLLRHLADLPPSGLCFHDAGHKYIAQHFDYTQLWGHLERGGAFVSDDIDASYAFIDFCRQYGQTPEVLIDSRKAVGVLARSG